MRAKSGTVSKKTAAPPAKPARQSPAKKEPAIRIGVIDPEKVFTAPGMAAELALAADRLSRALETGKFCDAIERNLEVWVAVKTLVSRQNGQIDADIRNTLLQVANQVATITFAMAQKFTPEGVVPLVAINLAVSKALVDGVLDQMIRDRAYYLWQDSGGVHGSDQQFWFVAEREIRGFLVN